MKKLLFVLLPSFFVWMPGIAQIPYTSLMGTFGQPRQFISELSDVLYNANARFAVTPNNVPYLFLNEVNGANWVIPAGTAATMTINLTAKGEVPASGLVYPAGYIYVSFYYLGIAASVTGQVTYAGGGSAAMSSFTNISTVSGEAVFQGLVPGTNYVTSLQLTITAPASTACLVAKIEYHRFEGDDQLPISAVTKYESNKLYAPLFFRIAIMFIRPISIRTALPHLSTQLGLGTTSPTAQLHTTGTVRFAGLTSDSTKMRVLVTDTSGNLFYRNASTLTGTGAGWSLTGNTAVSPATTFLGTKDTSSVPIRTNNLERMRVAGNGNVLIGKTTQVNTGYVLDVTGSARINLVVVNATGADFVVDRGYRLLPLFQVEKYIEAHHHLPDIAPAADMQARGMDVGANQTALLKKVEELTLYVIEQAKKQEKQSGEITELQQQNRELRHRLNQINK